MAGIKPTGFPAGKTTSSPGTPGAGILILCDFDGTACSVDMGSKVLDRFAGEGWREIDRSYCTDKIGSRLAYTMIAPLFRGSRTQMVDYVRDHATLDPHFLDFYRFCAERGYDLKIASDGLDFYIETVLGFWGLADIEFYSNTVTCWHQEGIAIDFPHVSEDCGKCGTCKSGIVRDCRDRYETIIYIGDSYSDVCPSRFADLVFAKYILYEKCNANGTACIPYETFRDVMNCLEIRFPLPGSVPERAQLAGS
jgi:2-hydroxy-3-keto-5-methylthiopentenyl-1-phosphate phosphatase